MSHSVTTAINTLYSLEIHIKYVRLQVSYTSHILFEIMVKYPQDFRYLFSLQKPDNLTAPRIMLLVFFFFQRGPLCVKSDSNLFDLLGKTIRADQSWNRGKETHWFRERLPIGRCTKMFSTSFALIHSHCYMVEVKYSQFPVPILQCHCLVRSPNLRQKVPVGAVGYLVSHHTQVWTGKCAADCSRCVWSLTSSPSVDILKVFSRKPNVTWQLFQE